MDKLQQDVQDYFETDRTDQSTEEFIRLYTDIRDVTEERDIPTLGVGYLGETNIPFNFDGLLKPHTCSICDKEDNEHFQRFW